MSRIRAIACRMRLRPIFAILFAVAMLVAPLGTQGGTAMALAPANHHAQTMDKGHCGEQPATQDQGATPDKPCCAAMCAAAAVAPAAGGESRAHFPSVERPSLAQFGHSFLAELPTPPPRLA